MPKTFDEILQERKEATGNPGPPIPTKRISITIPEDVLMQTTQFAEAGNKSRSETITEILREYFKNLMA